ncbi:MAG: hypothetical protein LBM98_09400 [Oscillospiraceae bacterium]|jgi:hypothetical protein|nr:hypothetical protein [Oscillospiraceae bacterium]
MNLSRFVSKTIARYLKTFRKLEGWEQLAIVYNSDEALTVKLRAYETILAESPDDFSKKQARRMIKTCREWLSIANQNAKNGQIFIAQSTLSGISKETGEYFEDSTETLYFTTFSKAKRWLDTERRGNLRDFPQMFTSAIITRVWLDSNRFEASYYFNKRGKLYRVFDKNFHTPKSDEYAENMFVDIGAPFKTGDIVSVSDYGRYPISYGVIYSPERKKHYAGGDFGDEVQFVFDIWYETLGHSHIPTWKLELFEGELPDCDKPLLELRRHLTREEHLTPEEMHALDPDNNWNLEYYWKPDFPH